MVLGIDEDYDDDDDNGEHEEPSMDIYRAF